MLRGALVLLLSIGFVGSFAAPACARRADAASCSCCAGRSRSAKKTPERPGQCCLRNASAPAKAAPGAPAAAPPSAAAARADAAESAAVPFSPERPVSLSAPSAGGRSPPVGA